MAHPIPEEKVQIAAARAALNGILKDFMPDMERSVLLRTIRGEEGEGIATNINRIVEVINTMPKTYEQDGKGIEAIAHLHYFGGGVDAWITEKDMCESFIPRGETDPFINTQHQAFGYITLTGNKEDGEWGYISIAELIENGIELDLYWTPKTLAEITA